MWTHQLSLEGQRIVLSAGGVSIVGKGWSYTSPTIRPPAVKPDEEGLLTLGRSVIAEYNSFVANCKEKWG